MSGYVNPVFRPDFTGDVAPPVNRLATGFWPASNPVGTETTQGMQSAAPTDQIAFMRPDGTPVMASDMAAAHQQVQQAMQTAPTMVLGMVGDAPGVRAFHGSPYDFERFDPSKIGTGEGAQAYGHGLYFAENEGAARSYRDALATPLFGGQRYNPDNPAHRAAYYTYQRNGGDREAALRELDAEDASLASRQDRYSVAARQRIAENRALIADPSAQLPEVTGMGKMYEVNLKASPEDFMHQDKRMSDQSEQVQNAIRPLMQNNPALKELWGGNPYGSEVYEHLARQTGQPGIDYAAASQALQNAGVPGIRYLDAQSRLQGQGTSNYVVFDPATIDILRKYGLAGLGIGLGTAVAGTQQQSQ